MFSPAGVESAGLFDIRELNEDGEVGSEGTAFDAT